MKQQEVDRKNVPKKIKEDKKRRLEVVNKSVALLSRSERKKFLEQVGWKGKFLKFILVYSA